MKPIKVAVVGEMPPPYGGISVQTFLLLKQLSKERVSPISIDTRHEFAGALAFINRLKGVRGLARFIYFFVALLWALPQVNILHIFSSSGLNFTLFTIPTVTLAKLLNKRIVVNYHGGEAEKHFNKHPSHLKTLQKADAVVVPSGFLRDVFSGFGIEAKVIENILELDRFRSGKRDEHAINFISLRNHEPIYDVKLILEAFAQVANQFDNVELTVVGGGSEHEELKTYADQLAVAEKIKFLGRVDNARIPTLLNEAHCLLNASKVDNMPVSLIEAQASGCFVITSDAGGIPYIIENGVTGWLYSVGDRTALQSLMKKFVEEQFSDDVQMIVSKGLSSAAHYDCKVVVKKWLELYRAISAR